MPLSRLPKLPKLPDSGARRAPSNDRRRAADELYKSPERRLIKAHEIMDKWADLVKEEPGTDASLTLYHFVTTTPSPNGFWTVTHRKASESPLPPPPIPPLPGDPDDPDSGGAPVSGVVYALHVRPDGSAAPGLPAGLAIGLGQRTVNAFLLFPYAISEDYDGGTLVIAGPGTAVIETQENTDGLSLTDLQNQGKPYWLRHSKFYELNGAPYTLFLFRRVGPAPAPPAYDSAVTTWAYSEVDLPESPDQPLAFGGEPTDLGLATPLTGSGGGGTPTPDDPIPPVPPIPPTPPADPESFACNCPDYTRQALGVPRAEWESARSDRTWINSDAGCDTVYGCKHIMATKLYLGMPPL